LISFSKQEHASNYCRHQITIVSSALRQQSRNLIIQFLKIKEFLQIKVSISEVMETFKGKYDKITFDTLNTVLKCVSRKDFNVLYEVYFILVVYEKKNC